MESEGIRFANEIRDALVRADLVRMQGTVGGRASRAAIVESGALLEQTARRLAVPGSVYHERLSRTMRTIEGAERVTTLYALLKAMEFDYRRGALGTLEATVRADLFEDELEIAEWFRSAGFSKSSAVTAGVVLEAHLRKLGGKYGIKVVDEKGKYLRVGALNDALKKAAAYDTADHKQVMAWTDLRDAGGHPDDTPLPPERLSLMIEGVRNFLKRHPA
ncbi:MAG: hypothetical protein ACHQ2Y_05370 [Candidatus Lutacidiplasmatales archaeon]